MKTNWNPLFFNCAVHSVSVYFFTRKSSSSSWQFGFLENRGKKKQKIQSNTPFFLSMQTHKCEIKVLISLKSRDESNWQCELGLILHDMLTGHSLWFTINTCTVKNSTVYQAETTSMCTVNRSTWMHHIVSR
jgi:hypothetical protein